MVVKSFTYQGFDNFSIAANEPSLQQHVISPVEAEAEPVRSLPIYTQEDMELAKTLAREEGIREGIEQGKREANAARDTVEAAQQAEGLEVLKNISEKMEALNAEGQGSRHKFSDRLASIALTIAKKVCGEVADKTLETEISGIINDAISKQDGKDSLKLHISPKNAPYLNDKFTGVTVNIDEKLEQGDFRISWSNGYAERDVKKIWTAVEEICSRHSSLEENEDENETENNQQG